MLRCVKDKIQKEKQKTIKLKLFPLLACSKFELRRVSKIHEIRPESENEVGYPSSTLSRTSQSYGRKILFLSGNSLIKSTEPLGTKYIITFPCMVLVMEGEKKAASSAAENQQFPPDFRVFLLVCTS